MKIIQYYSILCIRVLTDLTRQRKHHHRQRAVARADLQHRVARLDTGRLDELLEDAGVVQEVLPDVAPKDTNE